ncbi:hypothetical protein KUV50_02245 [Membranicola marinus]|uniref:SGNH hydrolase-type esterase domain-containing protein n=1 Tax=Membranihabitans marinus TaxID=1227546 RepID=A0A953L8U8_9BACT|nr:GDSL-type esterase/lipase family protein [Membranihabitans marinus]MBY5956938.1 hypothetical protein [Membranihabitans marinus]
MKIYNHIVFPFAFLLFSLAGVMGATSVSYKTDLDFLWLPSWDSSDTLTIVAFGNSITAERSTIKQVFAQRLPQLLNNHGIESHVTNSGIPGSHTGSVKDNNLFKIRHGRDRFETDVLSYHPDLVIIGFGTNDSYIDNKIKKGEPRIPIKNYKENLEFFITQLKSNGSEVILIAPNILGDKFPDFQNKWLLRYVKTVRKLAKKHKTGLVDNYKLFIEYEKNSGSSFDDLMLDGCHPNDKGHELIANHLVAEILKVLCTK